MAFRQFERTSLQLSMGTLLSCLCASVAYADTLAPVKPASVVHVLPLLRMLIA
ncbi:Outer membrane phospholipase A [Acinetobacter baumannii]|nr:Outer membrane phospholipase A [Acinetobacter baumannii]